MRNVFIFFSMLVSLSQYKETVGMFNKFFAIKKCIRPSICYGRKMQSCEFGLTMILFVLLKTFSILILFVKKNAWQYMLIVQINKKFLIICFYWFLSCSYFFHNWLFLRLVHLGRDTEKNRSLRRASLKRPLLESGI